MSDIVVFIGPSLGLAEAERIARFAYRSPAAQGDIVRAVNEGARVIGLIDGYFEGVPAVWHKEILFALSSGTHVFGAASMGALRAAELHTFGMRGVGQIYEWYATGVLDADDEVALVHAPAEMGFSPLSEPLVNVRATLAAAAAAKTITPETSDRLVVAAQSIFYKQRTWKRILADAALAGAENTAFAEWLRTGQVDQKQIDARAVIEAIKNLVDEWPGRFRADFVFEPTDAWTLGLESFHAGQAISEIDRLVIDEARLVPGDFQHLLSAAVLTHLAARDAPDADKRSAARRLDRFRREHDLQDRIQFDSWRESQALSEVEMRTALAERASVDALADSLGERLLPTILTEIKLRGLYGSFAQRASRKAEALSQKPTPSAPGRAPPSQIIIEWFFEQRLAAPVPGDLDDLRRALALPDRQALQELLAREFLFATLGSRD